MASAQLQEGDFSLRTINFAFDEPVVLLKKNPVIEEKTTALFEKKVNLTCTSGKTPKNRGEESSLKRLFLL